MCMCVHINSFARLLWCHRLPSICPQKCRFALLSLVSCFFLHLNADSGNLQHSPTGSSGQAAIERPQGIAVLHQSTAHTTGPVGTGRCPDIQHAHPTFCRLGSTNFRSLRIKCEPVLPSQFQLPQVCPLVSECQGGRDFSETLSALNLSQNTSNWLHWEKSLSSNNKSEG